jgi:hypothetical protein
MTTEYTKRYVITVPADLCEAANAAAVDATGEEAARLTWIVDPGGVEETTGALREPGIDAICGWTMKLGTAAKLLALLGKIGPARDAAEIAPVDTYEKRDEEAAIVAERAARTPTSVDGLMI